MSNSPPRLYLVTPLLNEAASFAPRLEEALQSAAIACVLLRLGTKDPGHAKKIIRDLAPLAQRHDVACIVAADPQTAMRAGADGVHVEGVGTDMEAAIESLKPNHIVGVGNLTTRDSAMRAGEAGVDYLLFGCPDVEEPFERVAERVAWWAEIFNVPCIGFARTPDHVAALADLGADFVALGDLVWEHPEGVKAALAATTRALAGNAVAPLPEPTR